MYENSIRVPALFRHPGRIPAGAVQGAMVSMYDVCPTLLDYLALPAPKGRDIVGGSFLPALLGEPYAEPEEVVIYDEYGNTRMIRTEDWKYVRRYPDGPDELWDLVRDPDERENRIADPAQAGRIAALRGRLEAWFARHTVRAVDGTHQPVSGLGQIRPIALPWHDGGCAFKQERS